MKELRKQLNKIKKSYFTFFDLRKISKMDDANLRVAVSRLLKRGEIIRLAKGYYAVRENDVEVEKIALEIYAPSYLSFEWALGEYDILSQKSYSLTLATTKRAKQINIQNSNLIYRHINPELFFGYILKDGRLIAEPEKAFLDLAYLSLNGYAKFDAEEMNLELLDKNKIKKYLKKFESERLNKLVEKLFSERF